MIVAFFSVYNEIDMLPRAVESIIDYVDKIIFCDGRYKGFRGPTAASNDGTVEFIKTVPKSEYRLCDGLEEWEKRNKMFEFTEFGDWIVTIDGDEVCRGFEKLSKILDTATKPLLRVDIHGNIWPRIYLNDSLGRYYRAHSVFEYAGDKFSLLKPNEYMDQASGLYIDNHCWERDTERKELKKEFSKINGEKENITYVKFQ
jgi:hypothetical protein